MCVLRDLIAYYSLQKQVAKSKDSANMPYTCGSSQQVMFTVSVPKDDSHLRVTHSSRAMAVVILIHRKMFSG